jgi:hypothetical protein
MDHRPYSVRSSAPRNSPRERTNGEPDDAAPDRCTRRPARLASAMTSPRHWCPDPTGLSDPSSRVARWVPRHRTRAVGQPDRVLNTARRRCRPVPIVAVARSAPPSVTIPRGDGALARAASPTGGVGVPTARRNGSLSPSPTQPAPGGDSHQATSRHRHGSPFHPPPDPMVVWWSRGEFRAPDGRRSMGFFVDDFRLPGHDAPPRCRPNLRH